MTQTSYPFDGLSTTETQFSQFFREFTDTGVAASADSLSLKVSADAGGMRVFVQPGFAIVRGFAYNSTAVEQLTIAASNAQPRIDRIVLRLNPAVNSIVLAVIAGTAAASPVAPALTQTDTGIWELPLGLVLVAGSVSSIAAGAVTDDRIFSSQNTSVWTTANRPATGRQGKLGFNLTTQVWEYWTGSVWGPVVPAPVPFIGRNRIINGDFAVNQRAFTSTTTTGTYGLDRWSLQCSGGTATYSKESPALGDLPESAYQNPRIVTSGQSAAGDYANLTQRLESVRTLSGKTVTVSFWARAATGSPKVAVELGQSFGTGGSPSADVNTYAGQVTVSTAWARYSVTVAIPSITGKTLGTSSDFLSLALWTSAGSTFNARTGSLGVQNVTIDLWGVQVEEGSSATLFEQKSHADELRACQRYYWRRVAGSNFARFGAPGNAATGAMAYPGITFPAEMRIPPASVTSSGTFGLDNAVGNVTVTSITISTSSTTNATLSVGAASGLTPGSSYSLVSLTTATPYLEFSAEL